jgi:hypothetical protein
MKTNSLLFLTLFSSVVLVHSQYESTAPNQESSAEQASTPVVTAASILGEIPDGTPPPPQLPKPKYHVASRDVLHTATHEQGGRTITIQQIKPIDLPPPPAPMVPDAGELSPEFKQRLDEFRQTNPKSGLLLVGATVFRSKDSPPRTLVRFWPEGSGHAITFWSSADFALIAGGINSFMDTAGDTHHLLMGWGNVDIDRMSELYAAKGREYDAPAPPEFTEGKASFQITGDQPGAEKLVAIQSLHDIYNDQYERLKTAFEGRERARIERAEYLKANPPQPKSITLNFWRTEKAAPMPQEGDSK